MFASYEFSIRQRTGISALYTRLIIPDSLNLDRHNSILCEGDNKPYLRTVAVFFKKLYGTTLSIINYPIIKCSTLVHYLYASKC